MKAILAAVIMAAAASPAAAALSGYWDSSKVIHAILGHDGVADALRQQPIESITRNETGYQIRSRDCRVDVAVDRMAPDGPGAARFSLTIGRGHCS